MPAGLQVRNAAGALVWDSTTVVGAIFADIRTYFAASSDTVSFPQYAGQQAAVVPLSPGGREGIGVSADTTLGYPRFTISPVSENRQFAMLIY
jgi:hypothetical protein